MLQIVENRDMLEKSTKTVEKTKTQKSAKIVSQTQVPLKLRNPQFKSVCRVVLRLEIGKTRDPQILLDATQTNSHKSFQLKFLSVILRQIFSIKWQV